MDSLDLAVTGNITVTGTVDGRDIATDGTKLDGIEANATADQTGAEIKALYEVEANAFTDALFTKLSGIEALADVTDTANVTAAGALMDSEVASLAAIKDVVLSTGLTISASYETADETKLDFITVTQAVDLDAIETRVNALDAAVILQGTWDASTGSFPGGGTAQAGDSYIVSTGGTVDSQEFTANDRIVAITDNASTTTYAANWHKLDYTDAVQSVAGKTGAVTLAATDIASGTFADARIAQSERNTTPSCNRSRRAYKLCGERAH